MVTKCNLRERIEMWCRNREISALRAKFFSITRDKTTDPLATKRAEKVEEPRLTISTERGRIGGDKGTRKVDERDKMIS